MNRNGQNALLKILEEPPKKALLLLVTHGAGGLLPTIRSRCRIMSFKPIDFDDLEIILNKASDGILSSTDVQMLAMLTEGSAGQAVNLLQENGLDDIKTILEALCRIKSLTHDQIDALALSFGKSGNNHSDRNFTFTIIWWLECLINMSANDIPKLTIGKLNIYIPNDWSLHYLVSLHENIAEHIETCINGSLDKRYMIYKALRIIQG